jgi:16S rRNA G966 N2-methylase RsmD
MQLRLDAPATTSRLVTDPTPLPLREPDRAEITGRKGSIYYRAHSYHTKVPPEGIVRLIEHYTDPGDIVVDPFCGSGMTGVAAMLTGRRGIISDLSPAACHIASGYANPVDPSAFKAVSDAVLASLRNLEHRLYGTSCPQCATPSRVEFTVWSDVFACPSCGGELVFWDEAVDPGSAAVAKFIECGCGTVSPKRALAWLRSEPVLESINCQRCRRVKRTLQPDERARVLAFDRAEITAWYPKTPFESWREMWRGQHRTQGIETAADFFTPRNLCALAETWQVINETTDDGLRRSLRFAFTSTINRASKRYQWNPKRPTNVLSSTMYIASLSYEFNVFSLLRRKLKTAHDLNSALAVSWGKTDVYQTRAQHLAHLPDASVHYVFTDPPFGSNIFYADSSFLWESWLESHTDTTHEAVVHQSQRAEHGGKSLQDYEKLMAEACAEIARVLRPNGWASVMFHNSSDEVWSALTRAIESADFEVGAAVAFDKSQASFKGLKGQLVGERVPSFDLVLHLRRRARAKQPTTRTSSRTIRGLVAQRLVAHVSQAPASRRSTAYLHSLVMRILLEADLPLDGFSYAGVESLCGNLFDLDGSGWVTRGNRETET